MIIVMQNTATAEMVDEVVEVVKEHGLNVEVMHGTSRVAIGVLGDKAKLDEGNILRLPGVKETLKGPTIKKNAKIGANATLLPGVVIGENSLVGAGSVVVRDVPDGVVVVGNPAQIIKNISELPY